jgi:predicted chitinase
MSASALQLFRLKYAQVLRASQDDQRGEMKDVTKSLNGASHEAEERCEQ